MGEQQKKVVGIIPARYASVRLPGKPLAEIAGKTMIRRVYEQAVQARALDEVVVATDDKRIFQEVAFFGGKVIMTSLKHTTGTDRVAEAALQFPEAESIVNVQGDQPLVPPDAIDAVAEAMRQDGEALVVNLVTAISKEDASDPSVVKTVADKNGYALYFSRCPIPYAREGAECAYYKVADVYGFRPSFLRQLSSLPPSPLEQAEGVEQLRILEHGCKIKLVVTPHDAPAVNTPEDLEKVRKLVERYEQG